MKLLSNIAVFFVTQVDMYSTVVNLVLQSILESSPRESDLAIFL